jgi:DNA/RNA endonuclease YhcR with UshA esterase domain
MKPLQTLVLLAISLTMVSTAWAAQNAPAVPRYDKSTEAVFRGTVQEVRDRQCPVSGGMGSHLVMRLKDGTVIEVHVSTTRFVHQYEVVFHPGDELEITGSKVKFEGVETILARKIKRGTEELLFRESDGKPIW